MAESMTKAWEGFVDGAWSKTIDVRDFIQKNYTPYEGDESFLAGPTEATTKLWGEVMDLFQKERENGGVLDMDTKIVSTVNSHEAGYIDKDLETIVGLQTDKPLKRSLQPFGGIRMAEEACKAYGYEVDPEISYIFTHYRKTHNEGVFDVYTPEMRAARHNAIITGLPDAYGRGRIIGDYRRVALYGIDFLIQKKQEDKKNCGVGVMDEETIRLREEIAEQIKERSDVRFVLIAGPSSSSKTTFSHRLSVQLRANGLCPYPIAVDNYFKEREETPKDENGNYDFEGLGAVDVELFNRQLQELLDGREVVIPEFNFVTGHKEYKGRPKKLKENEVLVIEGIHCLNPELTRNLPDENKFKIYISALTQLNIDEHNRIPTTDGRLIRRIVRDARTRGTSAKETIRMWPSVRKGEECNIFPYQEEADVMFNSALIYELAVLKPYVEAQLFGIERECPEYLEAKRLLKFLDYFVGIGSENVPANSLLREFIGGGCFHV